MCQPSPTIAGFLRQAEDNLALLRARAQFTPRKAREKVAEESPGSASARMSQRLRATGSTRASPRPQEEPAELELHAVHAGTLRDLDRKIRGFDARFKSMEKAVASAADLAAASSRCGRDGIEAATAATAAVRVEAEAKCRELAQRIESLAVPGRWGKDLEVKIDTMVQASLDHDLRCLERRLVAQFSKRHSEVLEAAEQMTSELKAEVGQQLQAFKDGRITAACGPTRPAEALALEGRLRLAEADLQRALRDVDDWERATRPTHHEQRIDKLEADLAKLFQRLGSTSDMGVQDLRARRGVPEAPSEAERDKASLESRFQQRIGEREEDAGSALRVPVAERTLQPSELPCDRLGELATKASGTVNVEQTAAELEVASNSGTPSAPPSPSMPSRPVVPFQPPSRRPTRPLLTVPGPGVRRMSGIHVVETPSSTTSPCECPASEIGAEQAGPTAEASAGARIWSQSERHKYSGRAGNEKGISSAMTCWLWLTARIHRVEKGCIPAFGTSFGIMCFASHMAVQAVQAGPKPQPRRSHIRLCKSNVGRLTAAAVAAMAETTCSSSKRRIRQRLHKKLGSILTKAEFAEAVEVLKDLERQALLTSQASDEIMAMSSNPDGSEASRGCDSTTGEEDEHLEMQARLLTTPLPVERTFIHFKTSVQPTRRRSHSV
ncbi:unnamed protein product [Symbiodinium sp. CCMP2456]|nr:unnamed protein product [Symbiodinium sp. CCMP2456]